MSRDSRYYGPPDIGGLFGVSCLEGEGSEMSTRRRLWLIVGRLPTCAVKREGFKQHGA